MDPRIERAQGGDAAALEELLPHSARVRAPAKTTGRRSTAPHGLRFLSVLAAGSGLVVARF